LISRRRSSSGTRSTLKSRRTKPCRQQKVGPKREARDFLLERLEAGPANSNDMVEEARQEGIAKRTRDHAKKEQGIKSRKEYGRADAPWVWELPPKRELAIFLMSGSLDACFSWKVANIATLSQVGNLPAWVANCPGEFSRPLARHGPRKIERKNRGAKLMQTTIGRAECCQLLLQTCRLRVHMIGIRSNGGLSA
jgi:hypothetical protein